MGCSGDTFPRGLPQVLLPEKQSEAHLPSGWSISAPHVRESNWGCADWFSDQQFRGDITDVLKLLTFLLFSVDMVYWRCILCGQSCEHKEIYLNNTFKIFQIFIKYFYSVLRSQLKYFSMLYTWLTCAIFRNIKLSIRFWRKKLYKCIYWLLLHIHLRKQ